MKRFLSLLTVFVLAFALAVPVGATDAVYWDLNGHIVPALPDVTIDDYNDPAYLALFGKLGESYCMLDTFGDDYPIYVTNRNIINNSDKQLEFMPLILDSDNNSWYIGEKIIIGASESFSFKTLWSNNTLYSMDGVVSVESSLITLSDGISYCDGSTCPATDVNFDDICDDCGMPLAYNLRVTPNTYEVVVKHSDSLTLKYSYTETLAGTSFNAVYDDNRITVSFDNPVNHYQYKLNNGEWELNASYPNTSGSHAISLSGDASILASDMDIYDSNGDLFFQNPLWMTVEKVTQGEMENLTSETAGTMKTLVVCGVGLMACLMALSLFGKRWLLFLR